MYIYQSYSESGTTDEDGSAVKNGGLPALPAPGIFLPATFIFE